jgi:hypothetical protein
MISLTMRSSYMKIFVGQKAPPSPISTPAPVLAR